MESNKRKYIIGWAIVLIAVITFFGWRFIAQKRAIEQATSQNQATTTTTTVSKAGIANVEGTGGYTVEQVPATGDSGVPQPVPDLNRKVTVYNGAVVTVEAKQLATEKILSLQSQLKENPADLKSWINLGIYQKMAGDYQGAVLSWKYASKLSPTDFVSVGDLGNLYAYFLKDNAQAEIYYKLAISNGPTQSYLYIQLAEAYRDVFNDLNKAKAIVEQGLLKIPNDPNLLQFQASLK